MSDPKQPVDKGAELLFTPVAVAVHRRGESPIFGEATIRVEVDDEAAGPFIVLTSNDPANDQGGIRIDSEELDVIVRAAKWLLSGMPK